MYDKEAVPKPEGEVEREAATARVETDPPTEGRSAEATVDECCMLAPGRHLGEASCDMLEPKAIDELPGPKGARPVKGEVVGIASSPVPRALACPPMEVPPATVSEANVRESGFTAMLLGGKQRRN
jgi:hypothetical protein